MTLLPPPTTNVRQPNALNSPKLAKVSYRRFAQVLLAAIKRGAARGGCRAGLYRARHATVPCSSVERQPRLGQLLFDKDEAGDGLFVLSGYCGIGCERVPLSLAELELGVCRGRLTLCLKFSDSASAVSREWRSCGGQR
jgi:hypothetical protein